MVHNIVLFVFIDAILGTQKHSEPKSIHTNTKQPHKTSTQPRVSLIQAEPKTRQLSIYSKVYQRLLSKVNTALHPNISIRAKTMLPKQSFSGPEAILPMGSYVREMFYIASRDQSKADSAVQHDGGVSRMFKGKKVRTRWYEIFILGEEKKKKHKQTCVPLLHGIIRFKLGLVYIIKNENTLQL